MYFRHESDSRNAAGSARRNPGNAGRSARSRLWNGPLWTLFWEIVCYVLIGLVFAFFRPELARLALLSLFIFGSAVGSCRRSGLGRLSYSI